MKLAYGNYGMPETPYLKMLQQIANIGYDGLEICVNPNYPTDPNQLTADERKNLGSRIAEHGLEIDKLMAAGIPLLESNQVKRQATHDKLRDIFAFGGELGLDPIIVSTTIGGRVDDWEDQKELIVTCIREWGDVAAEFNGYIAFEPHANAIVHNPDRGIWVLEQANHPNLKINFDYSHFELLEIPLEIAIDQLIDYTISTHVKDVAGRPPDFQYLLPGAGDVDYTAYLRKMASVGYNGFITTEISAQIFRQADYDPVAAAQFCYDTLAQAFVDAGISREK